MLFLDRYFALDILERIRYVYRVIVLSVWLVPIKSDLHFLGDFPLDHGTKCAMLILGLIHDVDERSPHLYACCVYERDAGLLRLLAIRYHIWQDQPEACTTYVTHVTDERSKFSRL